METPVVKKKRGISPVWILPLVALAVGGWLLYRSVQDAGIQITVYFEDASGIIANKTQVIYKGIPVGMVRDILVDRNLKKVKTRVEIVKEAQRGLVEDTRFWLVKPEISSKGVRGLETLLGGSYIAVEPGVSTTASRIFDGFLEPPPIPSSAPGLHLVLYADTLGAIRNETGIYYKNIVVGTVTNYVLQEDSTIRIEAYIEPEYSHLVSEESRFYNASGLTVTGNVTGITMHMESLTALVNGGIVFYTPPELTEGKPAENGHEFKLYEDFESARYGIPMTLVLSTGAAVQEGSTKLMYRGLVAGVVSKVKLNNNEEHTVTATINLDPRVESILRSGTKFWIVRPEISPRGLKNLDTLIKGVYITFRPGGGEPCSDFMVEDTAPPLEEVRSGGHFRLQGETAANLSPGTSVLYNKIQVGEVLSVGLSIDNLTTEAGILIYDEHLALVRESSVFWNINAFNLRANLNDFQLEIPSLKSILVGGVAFRNPDPEEPQGKAAVVGGVFPLHADYETVVKATPSLQPSGLRIQLFADEVGALKIGSPLLYRTIQIGEIVQASIDRKHGVLIELLIDEQQRNLVHSGSRFYRLSGINVRADLSGIRVRTGTLQTLMTGGIILDNPVQGKQVANKHLFPLYEDEDAAANVGKPHLILHFRKADGVSTGMAIKHYGIEVGEVVDLRFGADLDSLVGEAIIDPKTAPLFREDTEMWVVQPEFSISQVSNLDTLITGAYLALRPGKGEPSRKFTVRNHPPREVPTDGGLNIILEAERLGSLKIGDRLYYRQVPVGEVVAFDLASSARKVLVRVNVLPPYIDLIREHSRFWNVSGIRVSGGVLSDIQVATESLEAIIAGGIAMATPDNADMGNRVKSDHRFFLHETPEEGWLKWRPSLKLGQRWNTEANAGSDASLALEGL